MNVKLITHDRVVHADEVMAVAILKIIHPNAAVLRTRDPVVLRTAAGQPGVFLLDVGGKYDPAERRFDHHQAQGAGFRTDAMCEWPYATAGLVWKHFGAQAVRIVSPALSPPDVDDTVAYIDEAVIRYIDATDCGVKVRAAGPSMSSLIASFNGAWYEAEENVFPLVMDLAQVVLTNFIKRHTGKVLARDAVRHAERRMEGRVLLLETCLPWAEVVASEMPDVLCVIYPVEDSGVSQQWQIRMTVNTDKSPRLLFPPEWGGLEHVRLEHVTGIPGTIFCHRSRHLAGAMTMKSALKVAELAIEAAFHREKQVV